MKFVLILHDELGRPRSCHSKHRNKNCVCLSMCARVVRVNVTSIGVKCVSQTKSHVSSPASEAVARRRAILKFVLTT